MNNISLTASYDLANRVHWYEALANPHTNNWKVSNQPTTSASQCCRVFKSDFTFSHMFFSIRILIPFQLAIQIIPNCHKNANKRSGDMIFLMLFYILECSSNLTGRGYHRLLQYHVLPWLREWNGGNLIRLLWQQDGVIVIVRYTVIVRHTVYS